MNVGEKSCDLCYDTGHFIETTMCLSVTHKQQIGLNWKSLLFAINNSTKCISTNSHVIYFLQSAAQYLDVELLEQVCLQSPSWGPVGRWGGGADLLLKPVHQEGPNAVFPSMRERAHLAASLIFCTPASIKIFFQFFNKAIYSALWLVASPQVSR